MPLLGTGPSLPNVGHASAAASKPAAIAFLPELIFISSSLESASARARDSKGAGPIQVLPFLTGFLRTDALGTLSQIGYMSESGGLQRYQ